MSKDLYNTLEEALRSENVFSLLSSCNDIALVIYDSDNLKEVELLSAFFNQNNIELTNIKELVIHGKNRIAIRRKTSDVSSYFIASHLTYTGLSGSEMYDYSHHKRMLCIHIAPYEIKREHMSLIEKNRYMYQILISNANDKIQIQVRISLRELHSKNRPTRRRTTKYCKDKQTYLQKLIDSNYLGAAFKQCAQECKNGCDECAYATNYGQEKSCPFFQLQMAKFYEHGWYVPQNDKIAHFWKVKAARQGIYEANIELANDYVHGKGCQKDIEKAISILMPLADSGYTLASNALIDITSSHPDYTSPIPLIARLANRGDVEMIERMINIYSKGEMGEKPDPRKCEEWVVFAAEQGCTEYVETLAQQYEGLNDWDNATRWYLKLQELNPEMDLAAKIDELFTSKCQLLTSDELVHRGNKSYYGYECEQDYHTAYLYYKIATEKGNADAMFGLANCYSLGRGVEINEDEGNRLYELSANNNSADGIIWKLEELRKKSKDSDLELWKERLRVVFIDGEEKNNPHILRLIGLDYLGQCLVYELDEVKGIEYLNKAIECGDYAAIRALARCYCEGIGVEIDLSLAYKYIQEAANKGVATAYHCLGCMYRYGKKALEKDVQEGYKWYLKAAQKGCSTSQAVVADMLYNGNGVDKDDRESVYWLEKAAQQGHSPSQNILSEIYFDGQIEEVDYFKSRYWAEKAIMSNKANSSSYFRYAYLCASGLGGPKDYQLAIMYYEKLPNNPAALNNLGVLYSNGRGVDADQYKASEYFLKSAEQGSAVAMCNIAGRYLSGTGVEKNTDKAVEMYADSFDKGYRKAGINLADLYFEGKDVEKDINAALDWYESALEIKPKEENEKDVEEYVNLLLKLADLYYYGNDIDVDDIRANELYHIAAEYSSPKAYHMLGMQYYFGYGVDENEETAIYWFRKGASAGYKDSIDFLNEENIDWISNDDPDLPF